MNGTVKVKVLEVQDTVQKTQTFKSRMLIGEVADGQYSQIYAFEFLQDKVDLLDVILPEQEVTVSYNIRGKKWTNQQGEDKYFTSIIGWKVV